MDPPVLDQHLASSFFAAEVHHVCHAGGAGSPRGQTNAERRKILVSDHCVEVLPYLARALFTPGPWCCRLTQYLKSWRVLEWSQPWVT